MWLRVAANGASIGGLAILFLSLFADAAPGSSPGFGTHQATGVLAGLLTLLLAWTLKARSKRVITTPIFVLVLTLVSLGLVLDALWIVASLEKGAGFVHDQTTGPDRVFETLTAAGPPEIGICRCRPDKRSRLALPGGFETEIAVYQQPGGAPRPGVLLVHGNTWCGQRLSTYRLLATLLARRGYVVATFDKLGFGNSDDPFARTPAAMARIGDTVAQTSAALEHLRTIDSVDASSISVLGHSAGVRAALTAGLEDPSLSSVIAMPAPQSPESGDWPARFDYFVGRHRHQYELVYGRPVPDAFHDFLGKLVRREATVPWELYREPGHIPLMVLLGERDQPSGHAAIYEIFANLAEPKEMTVIPRSDHYANTAQSLGLVFYDRRVAQLLIDAIDSWLRI